MKRGHAKSSISKSKRQRVSTDAVDMDAVAALAAHCLPPKAALYLKDVASSDFRSDTVTQPTAEMRAAMALAVCNGDDVLGDDIAVVALEAQAAALLDKKAALFVSSGTQSNLIAAMVHCDLRGSEMIVGDRSHMHLYEQGGSATVGGIHSRTVTTQPDGTLPLDAIEASIRTDNAHFPTTRLVAIEQTHNFCGGKVLSVKYIDDVGALCQRRGLKLHIDGARLMHAAAAAETPVARLVAAADSVSLCLSKGLGAPIGSVLLGSKEFIAKARRVRKSLGGGMRQAGVLAAAGSYCLAHMVTALTTDCTRAKHLASALNRLPGCQCSAPDSNIVMAHFDELRVDDAAAKICQQLGRNVRALPTAPHTVRFVIHHQITDDGVQRAIEEMTRIMNHGLV